MGLAPVQRGAGAVLGLGGAVAGLLLPLPIPGLPTPSQVTVMIITLVIVMTMSSLCVTPISTWGLVSCLLVSTVAAVFTLVATIGHSLHLVRDQSSYDISK